MSQEEKPDKDDVPDPSKRAFLKWGAKVLAGGVATIVLEKSGAVNPIYEASESAILALAQVKRDGLLAKIDPAAARDLFRADRLIGVPGAQHPDWGLRSHPADKLAQTVLGFKIPTTDYRERIHPTPPGSNVFPAPVDGDVVVLGSPVSNKLSEIIFDYQGEGPTRLHREVSPTLPQLTLGFAIADASGKVVQWSEFKGQNQVGNWHIQDETGRPWIPRVRDGRGQTDYLLITRIRNFLSHESLASGAMITLAGGCHGLGTVGLLTTMSNQRIVEQLIDQSKGAEFQAIIEVEAPIETGYDPGESLGLYSVMPTKASLREFRQVSIPLSVYSDAEATVRPRLQDFLGTAWPNSAP